MRLSTRLLQGVAVAGLLPCLASAQSVISAKSGLIHYVEGRAFIGDQLIESKFGNFPEIHENAQLRTEEGRAEVLLTPGVFLRVAENSAVRMITNRLIDTRVEFLSGSMLVEAADLLKDNAVTIVYGDYAVRLQKKGLYEFSSEPPELRVFDGEASAVLNGTTIEIKGSRLLMLDGGTKLAKFDTKDGDALYRWARRRSEYLAMANVSAAKSLRDSGSYFGSNRWYWNPYFNMFTFMPARGIYSSPFGYAYWSPYTVYDYLYYVPRYNSGGGGGHGYNRGSGTSVSTAPRTLSPTVASSGAATSARSPSTAASGAVSSGISRGGGGGGGGASHAGGRGR